MRPLWLLLACLAVIAPAVVPPPLNDPDPLTVTLPVPQHPDPARSAETAATAGTWGMPCELTGLDGPRVQLVAIANSTDTDLDVQRTAARLLDAAVGADAILDANAARNGASAHLRFVSRPASTGACLPAVIKVTTDAYEHAEVAAALTTAGLDRPDRVYVAASPVDVEGLYGLADQAERVDDPGPRVAVLYVTGTTADTFLHETLHLLGAVAPTAPNSDGNGHCTDGLDVVCYDEDTGQQVARNCAPTVIPLVDCGDDDYFSPAPTAGSWLAKHPQHNVATSPLLHVQPATHREPPAVGVWVDQWAEVVHDGRTHRVLQVTAPAAEQIRADPTNPQCVAAMSGNTGVVRCPSDVTTSVTVTAETAGRSRHLVVDTEH